MRKRCGNLKIPYKAESLLEPFFGHRPQDFGVPPEPLRLAKDKKPLGYYAGGTPAEDQLEALENEYAEWLRAPLSKFRLNLGNPAVQIFREQLYLMTRAYSQCMNDLQACQQQSQQVENNLPQIRKRLQLRNFLLDHFPIEVNRAEVQNTDLTDLIMSITIQQKQEIEDLKVKQ